MEKIKIRGKRGINVIIVTLIIMALSLSAVFIIYTNVKKVVRDDFGEQISCFEASTLVPTIFLKNACYLNSGEIAVDIERKTDTMTLRNIKLAFFGENSTRWLIKDNKKCSDVRAYSAEYGGYCEVVKIDSEKTYVFNVSDLDKKNQVKLVITQLVNGEEKSCLVDTRDIKESC